MDGGKRKRRNQCPYNFHKLGVWVCGGRERGKNTTPGVKNRKNEEGQKAYQVGQAVQMHPSRISTSHWDGVKQLRGYGSSTSSRRATKKSKKEEKKWGRRKEQLKKKMGRGKSCRWKTRKKGKQRNRPSGWLSTTTRAQYGEKEKQKEKPARRKKNEERARPSLATAHQKKENRTDMVSGAHSKIIDAR